MESKSQGGRKRKQPVRARTNRNRTGFLDKQPVAAAFIHSAPVSLHDHSTGSDSTGC